MPLYRITVSIEQAKGTQEYIVEAANETEAKIKHDGGESDFEFESFDILQTGTITVELEKD